jgi:hypothetical protein
MQIKQLFFSTVLALLVFTSCKKDEPAPAAISIEGSWVGKSSVLSGPFENHFSFKIKPNGVLERLDANGQKIGEGIWEFYSNNTAITGTYSLAAPPNEKFSVIANFDKVTGKLDGTWGKGDNDYNGGYWFMNKID